MAKNRVKKRDKKAHKEAKIKLDQEVNKRLNQLEADQPKLESLRIDPKDRHLLDDFPGPKPKPPKRKTAYSGMIPPIPPPELLDLIHNFLQDFKYVKAAHGVRTDNQKREGHNMKLWKHKADGFPNLLDIFLQYRKQNPDVGPRPEVLGEILGEVDSDENNFLRLDETSEGEGSSAEKVSRSLKNQPTLKRKSTSSNDSNSDSSSDSSSSSDSEKETPPAKKSRTRLMHDRSELIPTPGNLSASSLSSASSKSSSIDSSLESDSSSENSSDDNDSTSDSSADEEDSEESHGSRKAKSNEHASKKRPDVRDVKDVADSSDSSATLVGIAVPPPVLKVLTVPENRSSSASSLASSQPSSSSSSSGSSSSSSSSSPSEDSEPDNGELRAVTPVEILEVKRPGKRKHDTSEERVELVAATKETVKKLKRENIPFSRIPVDIVVDEKFKSNKYVPYDYAEKAHQDLIVTKGKGFTKEKNKKKRGQRFSGGMIDILGSRAVKFDD